jgi:hypothetical protein
MSICIVTAGPLLASLLLVGLIWLAAVNNPWRALRPDDPAALDRAVSLGQVIADTPDRPVHIVFVHGMSVEGPGNAQTFMKGLCRYGPVKCAAPPSDFMRHPIDLGPYQRTATVMGQLVWRNEADWNASQPFVDRYVFSRGDNHPPIVVDDVNWWPLLFPLKCRMLVAPECKLSGIDKRHLKLCTRSDPPYYAWLSAEEHRAALKGPRVSGGGAWVNGVVKRQLMNWGLSDTAIVLGPMRHLFRRMMEGAFDYAADFGEGGVAAQQFVVVAESLGSFVVMDAATNHHGDSPRSEEVLTGTTDLYFFANQFALLELARISNLTFPPVGGPTIAGALPPPPAEPSPVETLRTWATASPRFQAAPSGRLKQIIAFSDPSDLATHDVPHLNKEDGSEAAIVVNIYDRNEINWFGVGVRPDRAHTGHSANRAVLKRMFKHERPA